MIVNAAILSIAAGAVHVAASNSHLDVGALGVLLGVTGVAQLALGVVILIAPSTRGLQIVAVVNGLAVLAWALSRTVGLPLPGEAGELQHVGVQDVTDALLGAGATAFAVAALRRPSRDGSLSTWVTATVAIGLTLIGIFTPHHHSHSDQSVPIAEAGQVSERLPNEEAMALLALSARSPLPGSSDHSHGSGGGHGGGFKEPPPLVPLDDAEQAEFEQQWAQAIGAAQTLSTLEAAQAAGYRQASTETPGLGSHWVKWSLVDEPFDPAKPSMLLFKELRYGQPPDLVGFSYWVASAAEPEGFAGPNDKWHAHHGMCFIDGWLRSENLELRDECSDTWIDGSDLWMLHAWPVPGSGNRWGPFADMNPELCATPRQTPDILKCDPNQL